MGHVRLSGVTKDFGTVKVIRPTDLDIANGDFTVFVGPSGCGKSTMLRMIAGLEEITSGTIEIDGKVVNDLPPVKRGISMVFQSYALYPHMSVFENIAFPLRVARVKEEEIKERVAKAARILKLEERLKHKPGQLSGGQRQRVAIGRAILREPSVFLFDEPLSNLDAALRTEMRVELARLHRRLGNTMIYVTHDQVEAMTMADRIVVLKDGVVAQAGSPLELYHRPANTFVAGFIGNPNMNFLPVTAISSTEEGQRVRLADGAEAVIPVESGAEEGETLTLGVRPSDLHLGAGSIRLKLVPEVVERLGNETVIHANPTDGSSATATGEQSLLDASAAEICVIGPGSARLAAGETFEASFDAANAHLFRADGSALRRRVDPEALGLPPRAGDARTANA